MDSQNKERYTSSSVLPPLQSTTGRLIIDPEQAKVELGEEAMSKLKLTADGTKILWPQPTDSPNDPQNWTSRRKDIQLWVIILSTFPPGIAIALNTNLIFVLAKHFDVSVAAVNNYPTNFSFIACGFAGILVAVLNRKLGRYPILLWSQLLALGALVGCTFAPSFGVFTAMRILNGIFGSAPQIMGLYIIVDMYPFHLQTRKLNMYAAATLLAPYSSPFFTGFLVIRLHWRWIYGIICIVGAVTLAVIALFGEETIYDRHLVPVPEIEPATGMKRRLQCASGITGYRMSKLRLGWGDALLMPLRILAKPHMFLMVIMQASVFGFGLGILITNAILLGSPSLEIQLGPFAVAGIYATPMVALIAGELCGRYLNDWVADLTIRRRGGVFEAEDRLWTYYIGIPIMVVGLVVLGISFQVHPSVAGIVLGWGIAQFAIMLNTVAGLAYANDCFPDHAGEVMGLIVAAWCFGGIGISYAQEPWVASRGTLETLGVEGAIVAGLSVLIIPVLQICGASFRARYKVT